MSLYSQSQQQCANLTKSLEVSVGLSNKSLPDSPAEKVTENRDFRNTQ